MSATRVRRRRPQSRERRFEERDRGRGRRDVDEAVVSEGGSVQHRRRQVGQVMPGLFGSDGAIFAYGFDRRSGEKNRIGRR